jgi:hypothetical protein
MSNKVLLITSPDDTLENAIRISVIGLTQEQSSVVSQALTDIETPECLVTYIWQSTDPIEWIIDKIYKSHLIIFNADCNDQTLVGFLSSKPNAHYFGTLRSLGLINKSSIYDLDQCKFLLKKCFAQHTT